MRQHHDPAHVEKVEVASYSFHANAPAKMVLDISVRVEPPATTIVALRDQTASLAKQQSLLVVELPQRHQATFIS